MSAPFGGQRILVTGGAGGIGAAIAQLLAARGAEVLINDVDEAAGAAIAEQLRADGARAQFLRADVSRAGEVEALIERACREGRLDGAVNNAGVEHELLPLHRCSEELWDRTQSINLKGVWLCLKYEIAAMLAQGGGAIVNIASVAGLAGAASFGPYAASKHGVVGLTRTAAVEYARHGIRVNAVCPGVIRTRMMQRTIADDPVLEQRLQRNHPVGRLGEPQEVAEAVLWLLSPAASFVHGHALAVDGAMLAQ